MCGIAGAVALRPSARPDVERVRRISSLMAHRGPDGYGEWIAPSGLAVLAHRRLAVIDLATGAQPMVEPSGQVAVTFNGEIYNYVELEAELAKAGARFVTASDTEVLLASYLAAGSSCVDRLGGMFAFAVWDDRTGELTLARDRVGKKPLYYTIENDSLYFSSTLDSLRVTASRPWTPSSDAVAAYLALGYIPAPLTGYVEAEKLEAATLLRTGVGGAQLIERFWNPANHVEAFGGGYAEALDRVNALLVDAVRLRLRSDVPVGIFLSGGLDSSLVAAISRAECGVSLETFSIGFDVAAHDESGWAAEVARHLGLAHRSFVATANVLELMPEATRHFGEPLADAASFSLWALARETRRHVTVALSGDGGDEGFGGYAWYRTAERLRRATRFWGQRGVRPVTNLVARRFKQAAPGSRLAGRLSRATEAMHGGDAAAQYAALRALFNDRDRAALLVDAEAVAPPLEATRVIYKSAGGDALRRMRCTDIRTYLSDCLMPKVDVATMAHALEARAPLLDHHLLDFAVTLPAAFLSDRRGGKRPLRDILGRYLSPSLVNRPKHGFTVPLDEWFRRDARKRATQLASSEALASLRCLNMEGIERVTCEHLDGRRDHGERLFALLALDEWARST